MSKFDIAIIGAGPGGYIAAIYAAMHGKKVILVEKDSVGGVCLNRGCIPTKTLIALVHKKEAIDFPGMLDKKNEIVKKLRTGIEMLLKAKKVEVKKGKAKLVDKGVIDVNGEKIEADSIIIATGSRPVELPDFKFDGKKILSSNHLLALPKAPKKLLIVGGGYIGCEYAYIFNSLGAEVTIVEMFDRLLPNMDKALSKAIELSFKKRKIKILLKTKADSSLKASYDEILVAVGRRPNIEDLGLEKLGIKTDKGRITVDEYLRTNVSNIYAIGDVIGQHMLAHVASHEGITAVKNILGETIKMDYTAVPCCVYTEPQIATVGLSKEEAEAKGLKVKQAKFPFSALGKAHAIGYTEGFVKMLVNDKDNTVLGVQIVGAAATELIAEATLAVRLKLKAEDVLETIHAHPTLSEGLMEAAFGITGKPIHTL